MASAESIASFGDVTVRYGRHTALAGVSFDLRAGDFAALVGGNGSGKTTVLRALLGFVRPFRGIVGVFGQHATPRSFRSVRRRIGYVPQCPAVDIRMPMSVRDVVAIGRCARRGPGRPLRRSDNETIAQSLEAVGIMPLADRPFGQLSGGERQKAQIARALCQEPEFMLLDEPTGNLDLGAQCECLDLLARIHRERCMTMLLVMHDLEALPQTCNRALILEQGRLAFDGGFSGLLSADNLRHVYGDNALRVLRELRLPRPAEEAP